MSPRGTKRRFKDVRSYVGSWRPKRKCCKRSRSEAPDPFVWSGRALQEVFVDLADVRSCINVSGLRLELVCSRPSWISARVRSHYRTGLNGPFGSPVFACAGKTDPPSHLILSQTSADNV